MTLVGFFPCLFSLLYFPQALWWDASYVSAIILILLLKTNDKGFSFGEASLMTSGFHMFSPSLIRFQGISYTYLVTCPCEKVLLLSTYLSPSELWSPWGWGPSVLCLSVFHELAHARWITGGFSCCITSHLKPKGTTISFWSTLFQWVVIEFG